MAEALSQALLNISLVEDRDLIPYGDNNYFSKIDHHRKIKALFQPALRRMKENLPYRLKDYQGNWRLIQPTKVADIIKEQVNIDNLKKQLDQKKTDRLEFYSKSQDSICQLRHQIKQEEQKCQENGECKTNLSAHLNVCHHQCTEREASYECLMTDDDVNGRCRHYFKIKYFEERLEGYDYADNEYEWEYEELLFEYKKALRIQQLGSADAYYEEIRNSDDYYDLY
jgi:hypothetical protein